MNEENIKIKELTQEIIRLRNLMDTYNIIDVDILIRKVKKLKALILLTDDEVSKYSVNEISLAQWGEYIRIFPEEG